MDILNSLQHNFVIRKMFGTGMRFFQGQYSQPHKNFGDKNSDKIFYVIRPPQSQTALMGLFLCVLQHLDYADKKGYIPVVDMKNYKTVFSNLDPKINIWEHFFAQPSSFSLDEVYESKNVILGQQALRRYDITDEAYSPTLKWTLQYHSLIKKYIRFSPQTQISIEEMGEALSFSKRKLVGVCSRGSDYRAMKPLNHPVQPSTDELISTVEKKLINWNAEGIYLTTEEQGTLLKFQAAFPNSVFSVKRNLITNYNESHFGSYIMEAQDKEICNGFQTQLEYLVSIVLLSQCDYFIGAMSNGAFAALLMNGGKYKDFSIINMGKY